MFSRPIFNNNNQTLSKNVTSGTLKSCEHFQVKVLSLAGLGLRLLILKHVADIIDQCALQCYIRYCFAVQFLLF